MMQVLIVPAPHIVSTSRAFTSSSAPQASTVTQRRRRQDPYAIAQAKAKKAANLSRQEVLKKERAGALGDPIRGNTTPFVRSFDTALPVEPSGEIARTRVRTKQSPAEDVPGPSTETDDHINFYLSKDELRNNIIRSKWLTGVPDPEPTDTSPKEVQPSDPAVHGFSRENLETLDEILQSKLPVDPNRRLREEHETAEEALTRISSLSLGSSRDRLRVNIQRCIDVFGRHNTDTHLPQRPKSVASDNQPQAFPRVGQDTGSSEVQIAILTAKIRALADQLDLRGNPDKVNKRNLRLLVHRRAKLLKYLRRRERGGPRWQNLIETLGLTDGTWKGEISL